MTPTFDFAAFLNSPTASNDATTIMPLNGAPALSTFNAHHIDSLDLAQANYGSNVPYDHTTLLPAWAPVATAGAAPLQAQLKVDQDTEMNISGTEIAGPQSNNYRSGIANHHLSQLRHCIPQFGSVGAAPAGLGGPGQRSFSGSHSSPSVPLSQASRLVAAKRVNELTIQERRRLARRERKPPPIAHPTLIPSALSASIESPADSPKPDDSISRRASNPPTESPVFNTKFSNLSSDFTRRAYSYTGFDMIGALMKVASRPNPKIDIGPVDLSCSFTVSDAQHPDQPIVHCSDTFCSLTGYKREEIIGRNCRFLQSPDGTVEKGSQRLHTDNGAVQHFRKNCRRMQECQTSLINYRKNGTPFINLVTIVPITWGDSTEPVFMVGFQVDLVEQPGAVLERKSSGLYVVNYSTANGPQSLNALTDPHLLESNEEPVKLAEEEEEASKRVIMAQELANVISCGSEDTSKWARILLENVHDLITVMSLKGTFLYVSPSVERMLGYKAEDMVGKSISEFCHPSDVVPVFRELKDSTSNASIAAAARHWARIDGTVNPPTKGGAGQTGPQVNMIMRMRHKDHGFEWIENVGKLHLEQGKGRKVVISTGRSRPVYNLPWEQARRSLDYKGPAFWSKVSQSGLILSTSGSVGDVLYTDSPTRREAAGKTIVGMHLSDVVDAEANEAISTGLHSLNVTGIPHEMTNGAGSRSVTVMTTLIPSSAGGEGMSTVFMHTQRVSMSDLGTLQLNKVHSQDASVSQAEAGQAAILKAGEPRNDSVFGELSTQRSTSWVFELHQLKIANKRLREEIRGHQRKFSGGNRSHAVVPGASPSKVKAPTKTPSSKSSLLSVSKTTKGNSSESDGSTETSISPLNSGSGSSSDSTTATSVSAGSGSDNPVSSGFKRSRS
jgi:PAS domain S-box-containing protein